MLRYIKLRLYCCNTILSNFKYASIVMYALCLACLLWSVTKIITVTLPIELPIVMYALCLVCLLWSVTKIITLTLPIELTNLSIVFTSLF